MFTFLIFIVFFPLPFNPLIPPPSRNSHIVVHVYEFLSPFCSILPTPNLAPTSRLTFALCSFPCGYRTFPTHLLNRLSFPYLYSWHTVHCMCRGVISGHSIMFHWPVDVPGTILSDYCSLEIYFEIRNFDASICVLLS